MDIDRIISIPGRGMVQYHLSSLGDIVIIVKVETWDTNRKTDRPCDNTKNIKTDKTKTSVTDPVVWQK